MKKVFMIVLCAMMLVSSACASELMGQRQEKIYETVKYCMDIPKDAQVINAMEYACNPGKLMHMLLIHVSQDEDVEALNGYISKIIAVDLETDFVYTYKNIEMPDAPDMNDINHVRAMIINSYDTYLQGNGEFIWMDSEIKFELSQEEINAINMRLYEDFHPKAIVE